MSTLLENRISKKKRKAVLVFPNHLFYDHPAIKDGDEVFLVEEARYFTEFRFHKQKLVFHRASMKAYQAYLQQDRGCRVQYIPFHEDWVEKIRGYDVTVVTIFDSELRKRLPMGLTEIRSPMFLNCRAAQGWQGIWGECAPSSAAGDAGNSTGNSSGNAAGKFSKNFAGKTAVNVEKSNQSNQTNQLNQTEALTKFVPFYKEQRKQLNILMKSGKPVGRSWSFDSSNRKSLPKTQEIPEIPIITNQWKDEAEQYVEKHFPSNPGELTGTIYPVTRVEALEFLSRFLKERLPLFGDYEDAMTVRSSHVFHSVLSPLLNCGLLTPKELVQYSLKYAEDKETYKINSIEGFIRQIIGWREYVLYRYLQEGDRLKRSNHFQHSKSLPESFYTGDTGIEPVDHVIRKVLKTGYAHHIERLMVLGNWMLLNEYNPHDVYRWFMEMFIDAYDWVMVPNVYGMSQYADGGSMMTKPYISSANYLEKMGDFAAGSWKEKWKEAFWNFIDTHEEEFRKNPRMKLMVSQLEKRKKKAQENG